MAEDNMYQTLAATTEAGDLLGLEEAAAYLGTSATTLYRLLRQDDLKGLKVGRQWRFRKADLDSYTQRAPVATSPPSEDLDTELAAIEKEMKDRGINPADDDQRLLSAENEKTMRLAHGIVKLAIELRSSDIHLERMAIDAHPCTLLRLRVDGVLQEIRRMPASVHGPLVDRFKIMADMHVSERKLPQDGRIPVKYKEADFDVRVSTVPALDGESLVARILDRGNVLIDTNELGLSPTDLQSIDTAIHLPSGIVLATGPTGSGKTTTLYRCISEITGPQIKVFTVEKPIEVAMPYATQTAVNSQLGITYPVAIRVALRQDPDVFLIGDIADSETALLVAEAAITGHLVLAQINSSSSAAALVRLVNLGVEPHIIDLTVRIVVAQRLCRRLCEHCKVPMDQPAPATALSYFRSAAAAGGFCVPDDAVFYKAGGCEYCRGRGVRGRVGNFEVMRITPAITQAIRDGASADEITAVAVSEGMTTLYADGARKACEGVTSLEEVMRAMFSSAAV